MAKLEMAKYMYSQLFAVWISSCNVYILALKEAKK
jgi:hypothetical protein